jgi:hypothetical protein
MSWRSWIAIFVVGIWGCAISPGWAKPPDLPAKQTVTCQPPVTETVGSDGLIRTGIDFNASPKDLLVTEEEQESLEPLDLICPCFWEVLWSYGRSWSLSLVQIISGNDGAAGQPTPAPAIECPLACPYLRESCMRKKQSPTEAVSLPGSVLENLDKLTQAQVLWGQAEGCLRQGDYGTACSYYARIQKLCPGSSYERMATEQLSVFHALRLSRSVTAKAVEEQETSAPPKPDK